MEGDRNSRPGRWRGAADVVLFGIGAAGAAWEIFWDQSNNLYVFALIVALLRLGSGALETARQVLNGNAPKEP